MTKQQEKKIVSLLETIIEKLQENNELLASGNHERREIARRQRAAQSMSTMLGIGLGCRATIGGALNKL